jgi:hypothetical protein
MVLMIHSADIIYLISSTLTTASSQSGHSSEPLVPAIDDGAEPGSGSAPPACSGTFIVATAIPSGHRNIQAAGW